MSKKWTFKILIVVDNPLIINGVYSLAYYLNKIDIYL